MRKRKKSRQRRRKKKKGEVKREEKGLAVWKQKEKERNILFHNWE